MEADNCVGKVRIQPHPGGQPHRHIGEKTHAEGGQCGYRSGGRDQVSLDSVQANSVFVVDGADGVVCPPIADAGAARVGNDAGVDRNNVPNIVRLVGRFHSRIERIAVTHAMAKKVARPARISVKKYEPFRSFGYGRDKEKPPRLAIARVHRYGCDVE